MNDQPVNSANGIDEAGSFGQADTSGGAVTPRPGLSVVFAATGVFLIIRKMLECLIRQAASSRIELILTAESDALLREAEAFILPHRVFVRCLFIRHREKDLASARLAAVSHATLDFLAFAEDHCFPESNWAEEIMAAFSSSQSILAAAPVMVNPNQNTAVSRAQFILNHGMQGCRPFRGRIEDADHMPWHSTVYRLEIFKMACTDAGLLQAEVFLLQKIRNARPASRFVCCTRARVQHVNMTSLWPAMCHAYHGGRIYGAERARWLGWKMRMRFARSLLFPLIPLCKLVRCSSLLLDRKSPARSAANFIAAFPISFAHALGEVIGTSAGKGHSAEAYAIIESNRLRSVCPEDRALLLS